MTTSKPGDPIVGTYIATVWFSNRDDKGATKRVVVRLQALSAENFKTQIRNSWPFKIFSFGPVSLSKEQQ
jgi:hypothetical protein